MSVVHCEHQGIYRTQDRLCVRHTSFDGSLHALPSSDPACDIIIQYDVHRRPLLVLLVLFAHDRQLIPWPGASVTPAIRSARAFTFVGLAPVGVPFLLLHLTLLFFSIDRDSCQDFGIPIIRLSSSGVLGPLGLWVDDDARDICRTRYITASSS